MQSGDVLRLNVGPYAGQRLYGDTTDGAETLSVAANVFMGQTEAPLIVKPYVPRMTNSELFTLMVSGFAHISGGMMAVYINYGADPVAVLTTCVMACPCSLYLAKLFLPETTVPETAGTAHTLFDKLPANSFRGTFLQSRSLPIPLLPISYGAGPQRYVNKPLISPFAAYRYGNSRP